MMEASGAIEAPRAEGWTSRQSPPCWHSGEPLTSLWNLKSATAVGGVVPAQPSAIRSGCFLEDVTAFACDLPVSS